MQLSFMDMVMHPCNPSSRESEVRRPEVQGHPPLHSELACDQSELLDYMRPCPSQKKEGGKEGVWGSPSSM